KSRKPIQRACMILGPPGSGKTSAVHSVAKDLGFVVEERNASLVRSRAELQESLGCFSIGKASKQDRRRPRVLRGTKASRKVKSDPNESNRTQTFTFQRSASVFHTLLLMDEVDGLDHQEDAGGTEFIINLAKTNTVPIVLIANEENECVRTILDRSHCMVIRWNVPPIDVIVKGLYNTIGKAEQLPPSIFENLVGWRKLLSRGDIRQAIVSLQWWHTHKKGIAQPFDFASVEQNLNEASLANHLFCMEGSLGERFDCIKDLGMLYLLSSIVFSSYLCSIPIFLLPSDLN